MKVNIMNNVKVFANEFVSGTGITQNKSLLWKEANKRFAEYIDDLRDILKNEPGWSV